MVAPTADIPPKQLERLQRFIRMLSSDRDGEVVAASRAIGRLLREAGHDWHDLAAWCRPATRPSAAKPAPDLRDHKAICAELLDRYAAELSDWEKRFVRSLIGFDQISTKQKSVLDRLVVKAGMGVANAA